MDEYRIPSHLPPTNQFSVIILITPSIAKSIYLSICTEHIRTYNLKLVVEKVREKTGGGGCDEEVEVVRRGRVMRFNVHDHHLW